MHQELQRKATNMVTYSMSIVKIVKLEIRILRFTKMEKKLGYKENNYKKVNVNQIQIENLSV